MIPYGKQNITQEDIDCVVETLNSEYLTQGPKVKEFEDSFKEFTGAKYAVAVSSGTAALHLSCLALDVNNKSKIITTPISFVATANSVLYCDGEIDFVDVDDRALLDLDELEKKLKSKEKNYYQGVIPVQFSGQCVNLERLRSICDEYGLWIIEDACHSVGGYFKNSNGDNSMSGSGCYSDASVFSFHPVKHLACGEGGMITTNNEEIYKNLLKNRSHGCTSNIDDMYHTHEPWYYEMQTLGYNYRLTDIQSSLGISQLKKIDDGLEIRKSIARKYDTAFKNTSVDVLPSSIGNSYHLYIIQSDRRLDLYNYLRRKGVLVQVHYIPIHYQPHYKELGWKKNDFPVAESYYEKCLSLPMYPSLKDQEQEYVIKLVMEFYNENSI